MDKSRYLRIFRSRLDPVRDMVVDYLPAFLERRDTLNRDVTVEQLRQHCEHCIGHSVPLEFFIGTLLYSQYLVSESDGQFYAGLSKRSPIFKLMLGVDKCSKDPDIRRILTWYGEHALVPVGLPSLPDGGRAL